MLTKDEQLVVLQKLKYADERTLKESRRNKDYSISKALFLQAFYGKSNKIKRQLIDDFFSKVKESGERQKIKDMFDLKNKNKMSSVKIHPISPILIK